MGVGGSRVVSFSTETFNILTETFNISTETFNMLTKKFNIIPETFPHIAQNAKSEKILCPEYGHVGTLKRGLEKPN